MPKYKEKFIDNVSVVREYYDNAMEDNVEPFFNFIIGDIVYMKKAFDGHSKEYYNIHREDGPALIQKDGKQYWLQNGKLHRSNGPCVVYPLSIVEPKFFLEGKLYKDEEEYWMKVLNEYKIY
jgi:hypothetical protein